SSDVPQELQNFGPMTIWQDQQNSPIRYDPQGYVVNSSGCGGDGGDRACPGLVNAARLNPTVSIKSGTSGLFKMGGVIYQPRGSIFTFDANAQFNVDPRVVTGAIDMSSGTPDITITSPSFPITVLKPALVR